MCVCRLVTEFSTRLYAHADVAILASLHFLQYITHKYLLYNVQSQVLLIDIYARIIIISLSS